MLPVDRPRASAVGAGAWVIVAILSPACATRTCPGGTCGDEAALGLGRAVWLAPNDWGATTADPPNRTVPDTDSISVGGPAEGKAHLSFRRLPQGRRVVRATLRLWPHAGFGGARSPGRLVAHRTGPFTGPRLTRRNAPPARGSPIDVAPMPVGRATGLAFDLTEAVRLLLREGADRLDLEIGLAGGSGRAEWRLASPRATDRNSRPRLELVLR